MYRFETSNQVYGSHLFDVSVVSCDTKGKIPHKHCYGGESSVECPEQIPILKPARILANAQEYTKTHIKTNYDDGSERAKPSRVPPRGRFRPSSHDYGSGTPSAMHRPDRYFPKTNTFSKSFAGRQGRSEGLITSCSRSRIHSELDEFH